MRSWIGTQRLLLVFLACAGATSCQQRNAQTASRNSEGGFSREHTEAEGATLSEEQIIAIADRVAWDRGFWPQLRYGYEEGNALWKKSLGGPVVPQLVGHNYHVIAYRNPRGALDGGLSVVVDKDTGVVLMVVGGDSVVGKPGSGETGVRSCNSNYSAASRVAPAPLTFWDSGDMILISSELYTKWGMRSIALSTPTTPWAGSGR